MNKEVNLRIKFAIEVLQGKHSSVGKPDVERAINVLNSIFEDKL